MISAAPLSLQQFFSFGVALCNVLDELHKNGQIHADIRPQNISWEPKSSKVTLAHADEGGDAPLLSAERLPYISPEQTGRMNRMIDYRTDSYSLGIVFYECLTGEPPFLSGDPLVMLHSHIAKKPTPIHQGNAEIPEQVSAIVMRLLEKNAEDRYQSAYGLRRDLEICADQLEKNGSIDRFELGESDFTGIFRIPQKLYGRDKEVNVLLEIFERISAGTAEFLLVAGYSGTGKTALVHEVQKPITAKHGYFIEGKFDQYQHSIPYSAWGQAFSRLMDFLLMESEAKMSAWKARILEAVGPNGSVLTDLIPKLESIIGVQPEVPELGGAESQNRFNYVFQSFVKVIAQKEHPLVVFMDDSQWIDAASLSLLKTLLTDSGLTCFLMICAYRDNEVDATHPLIMGVTDLQKENINLNQLALENLTANDVNALSADTLHTSQQESRPLAQLIYSKTFGNAFFTHQMLHSLNEEKLVVFDGSTYRWHWDIDVIQAIDISDNVVDLMVGKLRKLPTDTQELLKLAACIGHGFELATLTTIAGKSEEAIRGDLQTALRAGLLVSLSDRCIFVHDRVQQAAYTLIPEVDKKTTHMEIGRLLLHNIPEQEREERIFDIVNQLNYGADLLDRQTEKTELAELNLMAGNKAKSATAYDAGLGYLKTGIDLIGQTGWAQQYRLMLDLFNEAAEAAFLSSLNTEMEDFVNSVLANAKTVNDKMKVLETRILAYTYQRQYEESISLGLEYLGKLEMELTGNPEQEQVQTELAQSIALLNQQSLTELVDMHEIEDHRLKNQTRLLLSLIPAGFFFRPNLLSIIVFRMMNIAVHHGVIPATPVVYSIFSLICSNPAIAQYKTAYFSGKVSLGLLEKNSDDTFRSASINMLYGFVYHYFEPMRDCCSTLRDGFQSGIDNGDITWACYCATNYSRAQYASGERLDKVLAETGKYLQFFKKVNHYSAIDSSRASMDGWRYLHDAGNGVFEPRVFDAEIERAETRGIKEDPGLIKRHQIIQQIALIFGCYAEAETHGDESHKYAIAMGGANPTPHFYFYDTIVRLRLAGEADPLRKEQLLDRVSKNMKLIEQWAKLAPMNFMHMLHLIHAEQARISDAPQLAPAHYEKAILAARQEGFIQDQALCYDLASDYYREVGFVDIADLYTVKAHDAYAEWGAWAKVNNLKNRYPHLLASTRKTHPEETPATEQSLLDLNSVIKASQAIAGVIVLDKLLIQMMRVVIENAGAQRGFLMLKQAEQWIIEAEGDIDQSEVASLQSLNMEESAIVSTGIIHYVIHTQERVVLNDAANEGYFMADACIVKRQSKSILCTPLINQGQISGILYLENNLAAGAFTLERVELLNLLSSQMAMALDNAKLYSSLEAKLAELSKSEAKFRDLVDNSLVGVFNANRAGQFLFVNDALMRMHDFDSPEQMLAEGSLPRWVDLKQREQLMSDLQEHGAVSNFETEAITATGRHIHVLFSIKLQDEIIAGMVMDITERREAEQRILEYQQNLKSMTSRLIVAEEQERHRIATDLHDNVGTTLALSRLQLATASKSIDDAALKEQLDELSQTLLTALKDTRNLIFDLGSSTVTELGLGAAISEWVEQKIDPYHYLTIELTDELERDSLDQDQGTVLLRNVRELLANIAKHSRADRASILLKREGSDIQITVKDNGIGILDPEKLKQRVGSKGGFGLFSIEERMTDLSGSMEIKSKVDHGTTVVLTVPSRASTHETAT